jgi:hypothetical protein
MGFDLHGRGGHFRCGGFGWAFCLRVAHEFGWEPAGTKLTEASPDAQHEAFAEQAAAWQGGYDSNDWQEVADEDAKAIAAALDRAIEARTKAPPAQEEDALFPVDDPVARMEDENALLKRLADFARHGSFVIG